MYVYRVKNYPRLGPCYFHQIIIVKPLQEKQVEKMGAANGESCAGSKMKIVTNSVALLPPDHGASLNSPWRLWWKLCSWTNAMTVLNLEWLRKKSNHPRDISQRALKLHEEVGGWGEVSLQFIPTKTTTVFWPLQTRPVEDHWISPVITM